MVRSRSKKTIWFAILIGILLQIIIITPILGNEDSEGIMITSESADPPKFDLSRLPEIDSEEITTEWIKPKIEMLIITPNQQAFIDAAKPLAEWKNQKGVRTLILSNYSLYEGTDNAERIRNMIKDYYETENIKWVLLAADAQNDLIPIRYVYNPDTIVVGEGNSEYSSWDEYLKPTDYYYADLTGTWDDNENGKWGESSEYSGGNDEIDWYPEVYVGRLPASSSTELSQMVTKIINYEKNPSIGNWMNRMLLAGGISTSDPAEDEARLTEYIWKYYTCNEMNFTHLYNANPGFQVTKPTSPNTLDDLSRSSFIDEFNSGYSTVIFAGHGDAEKLLDASEDVYLKSDAQSSGNINMPSLFYADACTTNPYDKIDNGIGESLLKKSNAGAIGYVGSLRVTWYLEEDKNLEMLNRGNAKLFWKTFFDDEIYQQGKTLYESKVAYMESDYFINNASIKFEWERKNLLTYNLLGDPELDVYTKTPRSIQDPFKNPIYEGEEFSLLIKDEAGKIAPNARVNLQTEAGKYKTLYTDDSGVLNLRVPLVASEKYDVTITGHNLKPSYFSFTTLGDVSPPKFTRNLTWSPTNPSISDNLCFNISSKDYQSGLENIYLLISENDFQDYSYQAFSNTSGDINGKYSCKLKKLKPGTYSMVVLARDFANNTIIFNNEIYTMKLEIPLSTYLLQASAILMAGVIGITIYLSQVGKKKYERLFKEL